MWKLLSKASIAAAAAALTATTMAAPAHAESTTPSDALNTDPVAVLDQVMSTLDNIRQMPTKAQEMAQAAATQQPEVAPVPKPETTPVPMPRPIPEGEGSGSPGDVVTLPDELKDQLPESGVLAEGLAQQVQKVAEDQLDSFGEVNLPDNRRLVTGPNGELILFDPEAVGEGEKMLSGDETAEAADADTPDASEQQTSSEDSGEQAQPQNQSVQPQNADIGSALESVIAPNGPLSSLRSATGGLTGGGLPGGGLTGGGLTGGLTG